MTGRRKRLTFSYGPYASRVRVFERTIGGPLYYWDSNMGRGQVKALRHRNWDAAKEFARKRSAALQLGEPASHVTPTVSVVFAAYLTHETPAHSKGQQRHEKRGSEMWSRFLGKDFDLSRLTRPDLDRFCRERAAGRIDALGRAVAAEKQRAVRARTVGADVELLRQVCLWATRYRPQPDAPFLLDANPVRGYAIPREKNPRRPVATTDRYRSTLAVSDRVTMTVRKNGKRVKQRSYLTEILTLVHETGRRIRPILSLRYRDLRLAVGPHGSICWPSDTDKLGREWAAPLTCEARRAIDRILAERPGIGAAFLFPSPRNPAKPISRFLARDWLEKAEVLAELKPMDGSLFHAYRRGWATARKHLPVQDVAAAGGWKDVQVVQSIYQQIDTATLYRVVADAMQLREIEG